MDILRQEFKARPDEGADQTDALSFAVSGLLAAARDKALKAVRMVVVVQGQAVGEPIEMGAVADLFFWTYVPMGSQQGSEFARPEDRQGERGWERMTHARSSPPLTRVSRRLDRGTC